MRKHLDEQIARIHGTMDQARLLQIIAESLVYIQRDLGRLTIVVEEVTRADHDHD